VHTLALSKEEGEGGAHAHPPRPPLLPATHPPVLKPLIKAGHLTLLNPSPRHQNYTTPPHHRGLPPGAATPPIPPYPSWFPQQQWSRLEWARGIGSATPRPPLRRDAVGLRRAATPNLAR